MYSSGDPRDAKPTTWQNCANDGSANKGTWPSTSWQMSGSGVYNGLLPCLMYCVQWNTLKARPARKSREDRRPATGRRVKPVQSNIERISEKLRRTADNNDRWKYINLIAVILCCFTNIVELQYLKIGNKRYYYCLLGWIKRLIPFKKFDMSSNCGILSSL